MKRRVFNRPRARIQHRVFWDTEALQPSFLCTTIRQNLLVPRGFPGAGASSSPHDEGAGRGPRRGASQFVSVKSSSSPRPCP